MGISFSRNQPAVPEVKTHRRHSACFNEEEMNIGLDHICTSWRKRSLYQVTPAGFDLPTDNQPVLSSVAGAAGGVSALSFLRLAWGVKYGSCTDTDTQSRHGAGTVTPTSPHHPTRTTTSKTEEVVSWSKDNRNQIHLSDCCSTQAVISSMFLKCCTGAEACLL